MATPEKVAPLLIRPAREDDAASLREIFNDAVQDGLATFETEPRSIEGQRRLLAGAAQDPRHPILVAELRGWVAGWITLATNDARPQLNDLGEVTVFVRREFRNYGIGRRLMKTIQEEAAKLGYRKLIGYVLADNSDSLRLCRSCGWQEVGRLAQHAWHEGYARDVVLVECFVPHVPAN